MCLNGHTTVVDITLLADGASFAKVRTHNVSSNHLAAIVPAQPLMLEATLPQAYIRRLKTLVFAGITTV